MNRARVVQGLTALLVVVAFDLAVVSPAGDAQARPGGGQTFKSSSSPSKSSSSPSKSTSTSSKSTSSGSSGSSKSSTSSGSSGSSKSGSTSSGTTYSGSTSSGSGYASGYTSSGSSGGGDDGEPAPPPSFGLLKGALFLLVLGLLWYGHHWLTTESKPDWSTTPGIEPGRAPDVDDQRKQGVSQAFADLLALDPMFSRVLLEDFLYSLFSEAQRSRGGDRLERLSAYLSPAAQSTYRGYPASEVRDVVIGALSFDKVDVPTDRQGRVSLWVRFLVNYTEVTPSGEQAYYAEEVWTLSRSPFTPSRKPADARTIGCPSCGGPLDKVMQGVCTYCKARVTGEQELDWRVDFISVEAREPRGPMLTGSSEEQGNDFPTVFDPSLNQAQTMLQARDPAFSWQAFEARVALIFASFHQAWTSQQLAIVRPFLSDNLFAVQTYWVEAYQKQGLRNVSESPQLHRQEVCKVETDGHYDLITVRLHAQNIDYTVDASGNVVGGQRGQIRRYTEYWTFMRGKEAHGAPRAERVCPSCGAPIEQINMAGNCGSCGVKLTTGTFDWVLSRIEQDDVYTG